MKSQILFTGRYSEKNVDCVELMTSTRLIDQNIEEQAKLDWQKAVEDAAKSGKKVWDQLVYRLDNFKLSEKHCRLSFSTIPFSIRLTLKKYTDQLVKNGPNYLPRATYTSIFIQTSDNWYIFGVKSDKYLTQRKYTYIGGVFNKFDQEEIHLFNAASKEIVEELGIQPAQINYLYLRGAFQSKSGNIGFVFDCNLNLSRNDVEQIFQNNQYLELNRLIFIDSNKLENFCINKIGKEKEILDIHNKSVNE